MKTVKIKFESFADYVSWAVEKLTKEIPGLMDGKIIHQFEQGTYRLVTYEFKYHRHSVKIDFEMEAHFEWFTGNKQEDPDWVYFPAQGEYQIWGGIERLAHRLKKSI